MRTKTLILAAGVAGALAISGFAGQGDGFKRERSPQNAALKDALEGKAPPALEASEWLNGKAVTWKDLKGKVVLLDFWTWW